MRLRLDEAVVWIYFLGGTSISILSRDPDLSRPKTLGKWRSVSEKKDG